VGLLEKVEAVRSPRAAWPAHERVTDSERSRGHDDSMFSPDKYGDYLVTSNEVFSAAMLRARLMSSLTLKLYDQDGPEKKQVLRGPEYDLLRHVNPFWTRRRLAMMDELSMCLWGETVWALEPNRAGVPSEIWWLHPSRVKPVPDSNNYLAGFVYQPSDGGPPVPFGPEEIVWQRYPNPLDEFSALSPLAAARLAADTAKAMMQSNRNIFSNGLALAGLVTPQTDKVSFSQDQADDLSKLLARRFKGGDKDHRWAVVRYEAKFTPMEFTPKDAEFVAGLNLTLRQVANAYGIPVPLMNEMSHATLSNTREYERILWEHALVPDAKLRAEEIVEQFLPRFRGTGTRWAEHDFSEVAALQESETSQWTREAEQIRVGGITVNEWRKRHGMAPVPWGDVWWAPVNQSAVTDASSKPEGDTSPTTVPDADAATLLRIFNAADPTLRAVNGHRHLEGVSR
jgi:HK97 family phage portal protein